MIRKWWTRQRSGIKAAYIGGVFLLVGTFCTIAAGFAKDLIVYQMTILRQPKSVETFPLHYNGAYSVPSTLYTHMNNADPFGVVPIGCARIMTIVNGSEYVDDLEEDLLRQEAQNYSYAFDLVTDQTLVISYVEVVLKDYLPPPSEERIDSIRYYSPFGMGDVPTVYFPKTTIEQSTMALKIVREDGSLRLDPGDAVTLVIPLVFSDPGLYEIQFIVHSQLSLERGINFTSDTFSYGWMHVNNITEIPIKAASGTEIKWLGDCT